MFFTFKVLKKAIKSSLDRNKAKYVTAARLEIAVLKEVEACSSSTDRSLCVRMLGHFEYHGHICILFEMLERSVF